MTIHRKARWAIAITAAAVSIALAIIQPGCNNNKRLVEVFDNGPAGGPTGPSEGYRWVGANDLPPPGKQWAPVDPNTLTPQQRSRIR